MIGAISPSRSRTETSKCHLGSCVLTMSLESSKACGEGSGGDFEVETVESGAEALALMRSAKPFQVVTSDMRMPGMSGAQFLAQARNEFPDTVRIVLTGQSDLNDAIAAVDEGNIFRFLS